MDWTQTIALGGTLITYITFMCLFFYRETQQTIREWKEEHQQQIKKTEDRIEKNEAHWREMFVYMSKRLDSSKDTDE